MRRLINKAKEWAESLGKPVGLWLSDRQDAFVTGIAAEFPDVPHRYCDNHFLRDVAKPVLEEADSHAKVQMRRKVRGLRKIEQAVLKRQSVKASETPVDDDSEATAGMIAVLATRPEVDSASLAVVLDYLRGSAWHSQRRPGRTRFTPPGLRMTDALDEVRESIQRNLDEKKGVQRKSNSARLADCI